MDAREELTDFIRKNGRKYYKLKPGLGIRAEVRTDTDGYIDFSVVDIENPTRIALTKNIFDGYEILSIYAGGARYNITAIDKENADKILESIS